MELIKIMNDNDRQLVNARDLWVFLESKRDFPTWFKDKLERYEFIEGEGFTTISGKTSEMGGRPTKEYLLTLDMAKELCMLDDSEMGKSYRRYFIEKEKEATRPMTVQ